MDKVNMPIIKPLKTWNRKGSDEKESFRPAKEESFFPRWFGILLCVLVLILAGLYIYNWQNWRQTRQKLAKAEKENLELRRKLEYYSAVVDSVYQKLESMHLLEHHSSAEHFYPYYQSDKTDPVSDNTFVYDSYLDARVNSIEEQLRIITNYLESGANYGGPQEEDALPDILPSKSGPSIWPAFGRRSDSWGMRMHPFYHRLAYHYGLDISNRAGTPVYATADGEVILAGFDPEYGKLIKIEHKGGFETRYGHLSNFKVAEGDKVRKGQIIALMGSTGMSTGPHLHYEIILHGQKVNPSRYLNPASEEDYYSYR
ncbi:MAG TPA: M23 family metallopeptidase [Candidatus Cloacimonadota bacterium]|nr:M23 family metallopeptidase [Candidatus Cloacimonadota bacterium]